MLNSKAFTLLELVLVIVVLGILATVAIPRLWVTRDDAIIAKARNDVAAIRSSLMNVKSVRILQGKTPYPDTLDDATPNAEDEALFDGNSTEPLLQYPIYSKNAVGHWMKTSNNPPTYKFILSSGDVVFTYDSTTGKFDCNHTLQGCKLLTH